MTIILEGAFAGLQSASARSITAKVSNSTTSNCTIAQLDASFEAINCLTITVQALTSEIVSTADGIRNPVVICPILAVVWERDEWGGQCGG